MVLQEIPSFNSIYKLKKKIFPYPQENDDNRRFHPRALGANNPVNNQNGGGGHEEVGWMSPNTFRFNLELGLTTVDMNLCLLLWGISFCGAVALYLRLRMKWRRKKFRHVM